MNVIFELKDKQFDGFIADDEHYYTGCCETTPGSIYTWTCTRQKNHPGRHIAHYSNDTVCCIWRTTPLNISLNTIEILDQILERTQ